MRKICQVAWQNLTEKLTICCWNEYNSEPLSFRIIPSTYPTAFLVTPVSSTSSFLVTALVAGIFFFFWTWGEKISLVRPSFVKNSFRFRWYLVVINLRHYSGPSCKLQTPCSISFEKHLKKNWQLSNTQNRAFEHVYSVQFSL